MIAIYELRSANLRKIHGYKNNKLSFGRGVMLD